MKTVFSDTSTIAHLWANKQQTTARNSGNFFFNNDIIYSYGYHFPIARHYTNERGEVAVLFTLRTYSNTTSKHIITVRRAIPHGTKVIICKNIEPVNHADNLKYWSDSLKVYFDKLAKARKKELYLSEIKRICAQIADYCEYFGLTVNPALQALINDSNADQYKAYLQAEADRIKADEAKRVARLKAQLTKQIKAFRAYETKTVNIYAGEDYLRISQDGQNIETSQGIAVSVSIAQKFYNKIMAIIKNGGCEGNCKESLMGVYELKRANENIVIIGCHMIFTKEYAKIARALNW